MSASKENNLNLAYVELNKFCHGGDYDRAIKSANKILQLAPTERKAFHCKVICLIQKYNFKEALNIITHPKNANLASELVFEKAYTLYRLNSPKEALQTVDSAPELTPALKELRAQILYRLEQYQDCFNLYRDIVKNTTDDYDEERKTNMSAVVANLAAINPSADLPQFGEDTYELSYNQGSTLAIRDKPAEALPILKHAEKACSESLLEDGSTEEEVNEEVAIIRVQQAYCLQRLGMENEAAALYHAVLKSKPSDPALVAIASNNLVVINRESNVFDSRKRMKAATQEELEHKLNSRQRRAIAYNQAILAIYSNQPEFCKQCCSRLSIEFGVESEVPLIEASSLSKEGKVSDAVDALLKYGDTYKLAAVQLLLAQGDRKQAVRILLDSSYKFKPGILGALATLLCADNDLAAASNLFKEALNHYKNDKTAVSALSTVWRSAATIHVRAGDSVAAAACHEILARAAPTDARALARLVRALAQADPEKAKLMAKNLPPVEELEGKIDIDALESCKWMMGAKVVKKSNFTKQEPSPGTPASDLLQKTKNKQRKRKTKLPLTADLSRPPDPERWLPKYERSTYRKRRGGRYNRTEIIKGSQGMTTAATDKYDMSKHTPSAGNQPKSPHVDKPSASESVWQRRQAQKKKGRRK